MSTSGLEKCRAAGFLLLWLMMLFLQPGPGCADQPPALSISLTPGEAADEVLFSVTNQGEHPLRLLRWNTPLEGEFRSDSFTITRNGKRVGYIGKLVKRASPRADDYLTLKAGETASATVRLSLGYDLSLSGIYQVRFNSFVEYTVLDPATKPQTLRHKLQSNILTVVIDAVLQPQASARQPLASSGCTAEQVAILDAALDTAEDYARKARDALNRVAVEERPAARRYTAWFGEYSLERYSTVAAGFSAMSTALADATIDFRCDCTANYLAYVYPDEPYVIYLCSRYWTIPASGTDSQAGTIIHEMSHFHSIAGTDDHVYGQESALALAVSNPDEAVDNADNFEYFAENQPFLPMAPVYVPADFFAQAPVAGGLPVYAMGSSVGASKEPGEPDHAGNPGGRSLWLSWTAPRSAVVTIQTFGSSFDTLLAVYSGDEPAGLSLIVANDDADSAGGIYQSSVTLNAVAMETYRIAVDGFGGASGNVYLSISSLPGDVNLDGQVDLTDLLLTLRLLAGVSEGAAVAREADVDGDGLIGPGEALFLLQTLSNTVLH